MSAKWCQSLGWMRCSLGLGYAHVHARAHDWCHRGEMVESRLLQLAADPQQPTGRHRETGRQTDREAGQQNLMSVFNHLFEVTLKKKSPSWILNYRDDVSISV